MGIRVLRLIEYTYQDEKTAARDMARWTNNVAGTGMEMRGAILPFEAVEFEEIVEPAPEPFAHPCRFIWGNHSCKMRPIHRGEEHKCQCGATHRLGPTFGDGHSGLMA